MYSHVCYRIVYVIINKITCIQFKTLLCICNQIFDYMCLWRPIVVINFANYSQWKTFLSSHQSENFIQTFLLFLLRKCKWRGFWRRGIKHVFVLECPTKLERCSGGRYDPIAIKKITDEQTMRSAPIVSRSMGLDELPHQQINEDGMLYIDNGRETEVFTQPSAHIPQNGSANHTHGNNIITLRGLLFIPDAEDSKTQNELVSGNGDFSFPGSSDIEAHNELVSGNGEFSFPGSSDIELSFPGSLDIETQNELVSGNGEFSFPGSSDIETQNELVSGNGEFSFPGSSDIETQNELVSGNGEFSFPGSSDIEFSFPGSSDIETQYELVSGNGDLSIPGSPDMETQGPVPEPHAQSNSTKADHPSPVLVLQVTPSDGEIPSGTESFETVHTDRHEGQVHDGLGKFIFEAIPEHDFCISSDIKTSSKFVYEQAVIRNAIRESAYILDVLRESGLEDGFELDDVLMPKWHASQSPLDPWLFNTLEKKYGDNMTWSRSNRRHLFDRINKVLFEMFRSFVDPQLSVKVDPDWVKYGIVSEVKNLLWIEEKSAYDYKSGTSSELNLVCPDFEDEGANMIATELEKLLMDDLIDEIVNTYIE